MNRQLLDIGVNSTAGKDLPPLHFDLVRVKGKKAAAHVFETQEFGFIVVTRPMVDEMLALSTGLVTQNRAFMVLQIAPDAKLVGHRPFLRLPAVLFLSLHMNTPSVRRHLEANPPMLLR